MSIGKLSNHQITNSFNKTLTFANKLNSSEVCRGFYQEIEQIKSIQKLQHYARSKNGKS